MKLRELFSFQRLGPGRTLLLVGIALRILVFAFLDPVNNDRGHVDFVTYLVEHHALPPVAANAEAYQPPLYYLLTAPPYAATGSLKCAQAISLLFSILTLVIFYRLFYVDKLVSDEHSSRYCFAIACFLPQFVMFGLYISNDSLAVLLGALLIWQLTRLAAAPNLWRATLLVLWTSLGLLTKATFLAFLPVLFAAAGIILLRLGHPASKAFAAALAVTILAAGLGSWRYVKSYREVHDPFVSALDAHYKWVVAQQGSYRGAASFLDVDLLKLVDSPSVSPKTEGSYPLLLYGTFWYQHIPESNFEVSQTAPYYYLGSVIYMLAVIPSALFLVGLLLLLKHLPDFLTHRGLSQLEDRHLFVAFAAVAFLLGNLLIIVVVTAQSHVWSIMQGRLLFPSFAGMLLPFGIGAGAFAANRRVSALLNAAMLALTVCFCLFYVGEISSQLGGWPFI